MLQRKFLSFFIIKGLPKDILASSFGKCSKEGPVSKYMAEDIMKSMLISITINTG